MIKRSGFQNCVVEWALLSGRHYSDPFNEVEIDVIFTDPEGHDWQVPTYWAGDDEWRIRFSPRMVGEYAYRTVCTDQTNTDLHGQEGVLTASAYQGNRTLLQHGPLRVHESRRYLEHIDGTPFFWLADIWWLGMTKRLSWPEGFQLLTADRVTKGFSVVQTIAGLPCDMPAFDERGFNEAGHPWAAQYARINPTFFDMMDLRIQWLVRSGLVPCIFGAFGFHLLWMGMGRMKQHWRNLVARYGAYPVIWCLAGCVPMPYYLSQDRDRETEQLRAGWKEMASYLRHSDPYGHPALMQPLPYQLPLDEEATAELLDGYLLLISTGRSGRQAQAVSFVRQMASRQPRKPVIAGEGPFEGLPGCAAEDQRLNFWSFALAGVAGFTYSATGMWQFNNEGDLFGPSPYGTTHGNVLWTDAYHLPGSGHVGLGKRLLGRYRWWQFESHPEWIEPHADETDPMKPYAAGIPGEVRIFYLPNPIFPPPWGEPVTLNDLEPGVTYRGFFFDPKEGLEYDVGLIAGCACRTMPLPPVLQDWVLVLERIDAQ